jgi:thiol:disulfide interchange protein DsbC
MTYACCKKGENRMRKYSALACFGAILLVVFICAGSAHAFGGCEENCQKCHTLEQKEVQDILAKMKAPDVKVLDIKMSPVRGLWEVAVDNKGSRGVMYVGFSKKYIMPGPIYEVDTASNKTRESLVGPKEPADRYVDPAKIPVRDALLLGEETARYKVIVFTDPDCPFCGKLHAELKKVVSENKDIAFYLELMPLKFHPDSYWKSQSILCAKSIQRLEQNFEKRPIPKPDCETKVVDETLKLARELGITGTPTLIMPDGRVVVGGRDADKIMDLVLNSKKKG